MPRVPVLIYLLEIKQNTPKYKKLLQLHFPWCLTPFHDMWYVLFVVIVLIDLELKNRKINTDIKSNFNKIIWKQMQKNITQYLATFTMQSHQSSIQGSNLLNTCLEAFYPWKHPLPSIWALLHWPKLQGIKNKKYYKASSAHTLVHWKYSS